MFFLFCSFISCLRCYLSFFSFLLCSFPLCSFLFFLVTCLSFLSCCCYISGAAYRLEKDLLTITKHEWMAESEEKKLLGSNSFILKCFFCYIYFLFPIFHLLFSLFCYFVFSFFSLCNFKFYQFNFFYLTCIFLIFIILYIMYYYFFLICFVFTIFLSIFSDWYETSVATIFFSPFLSDLHNSLKFMILLVASIFKFNLIFFHFSKCSLWN